MTLIFGTNDVLIKSFRFLLTFNKVNSKSPNSLIAPSNFSTLKTSFMTSIMIHWRSSIYYVSMFLDLLWPIYPLFNINTVLYVSKNRPFLNRQRIQPSSPFKVENICFQKFVDITQQCFALSSQVKFEFSFKLKVMGSNPGYLFKSFFTLMT